MNVFFPIETINRELDYKLTLAAQIADGKRKIYLGNYQFLNRLMPHFKNGLYVGKNIFGLKPEFDSKKGYKNLKDRGIDIIYLHEEGGVFPGGMENWKDSIKENYDANDFSQSDIICTWGRWQKDFDLERSNFSMNVISTGHPRFDLYKNFKELYQDDVSDIKNEFGDYILINGNYAWANHGRGIGEIFSDTEYEFEDYVKRLKTVGVFREETMKLVSMVELVHHLSIEFPDINFVYRPHPSENHDYYNIVFRQVQNIIVKHKGPVGPWILGAKAMIHDGCTTSIEGQLSGIPVINYKPFIEEFLNFYLPDHMGIQGKNQEEIKNLVYTAINQPDKFYDNFKIPQLALDLLENFNSDSFNLLNTVIENKETDYLKINNEFQRPSKLQIDALYRKRQFILFAHNALNLFLNRQEKIKRLKYNRTKYPGLDKEYIKSKLDILEKRFDKNLRCTFHNSYLIEIS